MADDGIVVTLLTLGGAVLSMAVPISVVVGLVWLAQRHLSGRHSRLDGLFTGIGRANAMNSHLQAGTPHPDDLAVPLPPAPHRRRRPRRPSRTRRTP